MSDHELTGGHYLQSNGGHETGSGIVKTDRVVEPGNTYVVNCHVSTSGNPDPGIMFGAQDSISSFSDYTGYMFIDRGSYGTCEIQRWANGSKQQFVEGSAWPRGEPLRIEIDYRDTGEDIRCRVYDENDTEQVNVAMDNQTLEQGYPGFYHYRDEAFEIYSMHIEGYDSGSGGGSDPEPTDPLFESWEDGSSAMNSYGGNVEQFEVQEVSNKRHETFACRANNVYGHIINGGANGPERGVEFAQSYFPASGANASYRFITYFAVQGVDSNPDRYGVQVNHSESRIEFGIRENGSWTWPSDAMASFDPSGMDGQWNEMYVDFDTAGDGTIEFWVEDPSGTEVVRSSYTDTTYDAGGWGYASWTNADTETAGWFDYLRQTNAISIDPPQNLSVVNTTGSSVSVSWDPPADTSSIEEYRVYFDGIHDQTLDASDTLEATIGGLNTGTTYEVGVTSSSGDSESDPTTVDATTDDEASANLDLDVQAPSNLLEGETAEFVADITNNGDETVEIDAELFFDVEETQNPDPSVTANLDTQAADTNDTRVRLNGELVEFSNANELDLAFRYRQTGGYQWQTTPRTTASSPQTLSHDINWDDLTADPDSTVEYQIVAFEPSDSTPAATGDTVNFTTPAEETSGGGMDPSTSTIAINYDSAYDSSLEFNGLSNAYDLVVDQREGGVARLDQSQPQSPYSNMNTSELQGTQSGSCPSKSSNSLVQFDQRLTQDSLPQEVYFEYDMMFDGDQFVLSGDDRFQFFWNMNRYGNNSYNATDGNGFSNALYVTSRWDRPSNAYNFYSVTHDSRGAGVEHSTTHSIPVGEWFTFKGYVKCNDIGSSNAVMRYWHNDTIMQEMTGFQTSADQDGWAHEFGPTGFYSGLGCNASGYDRLVYFDRPRFWVDSDIPSEIRE